MNVNIDDVKTISTIAAPFSKILIETFLKPKIEYFKKKYDKQEKIIEHFFENTFADYLNNSYEKYSTLNTVAFKRNKIMLKDVYMPLTITNDNPTSDIIIDEIHNSIFVSNKILIIDTAGMGKSTLSKKLILSCIEINYGIPILIDLRRLSRSKDIINEVLEQLKPINEEIDKQLVLDLIKRGDFIFFLDGYDEILLAEKTHVTTEIQNFTKKANNNKFILTSRPEDSLSSFGNFDKYRIRNLQVEESFELIRKYGNYNEVSQLLIKKIKEPEIFKNIEEYLNSPLLVSLLYAAFEYKQKVPFEKHNFYRQVFDSLYESHDLSKGDSYEREKLTKLSMDEFHKVLRALAFNCLKMGNKIEFSKDEFIKILEITKNDCSDLAFGTSDLIKDLLLTVPIFTQDGLYYRWSHKSLQEYFAAQYIYCDAKEDQKVLLEHIAFHTDNFTFYNVLDLYFSIDPEFFKQVVIYKLLKDYFIFSNDLFTNIADKNERLFRSQIMFTNYIYLIKNKYDEHGRETDIFKIIKKFNPQHEVVAIVSVHRSLHKNIGFISVPIIPNSYEVLLKLLYAKKISFVQQADYKLSSEESKNFKVHLNLVEEKIYPLNKRKNSIFNKEIHFININLLLKLFLCSHIEFLLIIDEDKAKEYLKNIEDRIKIKKKNRNLDF